MKYRSVTLNKFIDSLISLSEEREVRYNPMLSTENDRTKGRLRCMSEWYVQQPHGLQLEIYNVAMELASQIENLGVLGAFEVTMQIILMEVKSGKTVRTRKLKNVY